MCLEECDEKSPCECGALVHVVCLKKVNKPNCTICKTPLNHFIPKINEFAIDVDVGVEVEVEVEVDDDIEIYVERCVAFALLISFVCYLIAGWVGKSFLMLFYPVENFALFWTFEHAVCSLVTLGLISFLMCLFRTCVKMFFIMASFNQS